MPPSTARTALILPLVVIAALLVMPSAAGAASPAAASITACRTDSVTVAGKVKVTGSLVRKVRGATLQMRFQALPLFGLPNAAPWKVVGRKTSASGQQDFTGLGAGNWIGVLSWRFQRGSKTVLSGDERSQPLRIGGAKGSANCTIAEGAKPADTTPPTVSVFPADANWHRAPATVQVSATDDFSGVKNVTYSVDGGAATQVPNNGSFSVAGEGQHTVTVAATDVAGNTGTKTIALKVDAAPPSKPSVTGPPTVTANPRPTISWTPSTDSGSGLRGYFVTLHASDGSVVFSQPVDANTTALVSPVTLTEGQTYTVTVTAVDNTADSPWAANSDPYSFRVDSHADASFNPASGTVLSGNAKNQPISVLLDRAANPGTVSTSTVVLTRGDGSKPGYTVSCANTPCTTLTVTPSSPPLGEGHYTLTLNGVKSADEGLTYSATGSYAVPFVEGGSIPATSSLTACSSTSSTYPVTASDANQQATLDLDVTNAGSAQWTLQALQNGTVVGTLTGTSSGHYRLTFPSPASGTLAFKLSQPCPQSAAVSASGLLGSRVP